jgi:DNA-binding GntR family transcriptional regulator
MKSLSPKSFATAGLSKVAAITLASEVYNRIRADILVGLLEPGRKLRIEFLCRHYKIGHIPIREALNRLSSDGLVVRQDQRGFRVAPTSAEDLEELTKTRCWLEGIALRESISRRTKAWEEDVVLAHYRLSKTPRSLSAKVYRGNPEWERLHREFHLTLISNCGSRWMVDFCAQLADQSNRYRQIAFREVYPRRNDKDGHRPIVDASLNGQMEKAVKLLHAHLQFTAETILNRGCILSTEPDPSTKRLPRKPAQPKAKSA